jgi:PAS domain S-box-containing protein
MNGLQLLFSYVSHRLVPFLVSLATLALFLPLQSLAQNEHLPDHQAVLKSASELDYPPFSVVKPDGTASGFSVELLHAAAAAAGFDVSFKVGPWSELKEELAAGALDVLPLVSYSAEREKIYDFTAPYLQMNGAVFVRKGNTTIRKLSDLMGKEVLVMRGDTAHEYVIKENLTDKIIPTTSYEEAFRLLAAGKHEAVVVQQIVGLEIIKKLGINNVIPVQQKTISTLKPVALKLEGFEQKFCFGVRKGNHELQSRLNEGLTVIYLNGTYQKLYEKWFTPILPEPKISAGAVFKIILVILAPLLLIFALFGIWSLKRLVAKRTQVLEQEIQQRKLTEEHLSKSEGHFRTLVKTIPDLIWLKDTDGVFLACNPMFEDFFGAREADIIGKTDYNFVDRELADFFIKNDRRAMAAGKPSSNEEWLTFASDGHRALYETIKTPLLDSNGTIIGVLGIARDISERKRAEEERARLEAQLMHAKKMEAIGVLSGGIAHDFNNILSAILGFTELARNSHPTDQQLQEDLNEIYTAGSRAKELVQRFLTFSRQQKHSPVLLDVPEIVEEALKLLRSTLPATIDLQVTINEGLGLIRAEPTHLDQIIISICINASQAMENNGGILTITISETTPSDDFFTNHPNLARGDYVKLVFQDTGTGIAPEIIGSVFDPYFTTKNYGDGTGLGLSETYGIIQEMHGDITIESELGTGSIVTVLLPVAIREDSNAKISDSQNMTAY